MNEHGATARFLRTALGSASREAHELLRRPGLEQVLRHLGVEAEQAVLEVPEDGAQLEGAYLSIFDVGAPHPPVPLVEAHWVRHKRANQVVSENDCFYRAFGFRVEPGSELPDHLGPQLAFVEYLLWAIEARETAGTGADDFRRALGDFVTLHLLSWVPLALRAIRELPEQTVFTGLMVALASWLEALAADFPKQVLEAGREAS